MTLPLPTPVATEPAESEDDDLINDPGNEDPGSIEKDALVPLIEGDDVP
jgi:hypothetical protein